MNGNALRGEIARNGLRQSDVAKKIGMSVKTFNQKLNGKSTFGVDEAQKLVEVLGIKKPADIFFTPRVTPQVTKTKEARNYGKARPKTLAARP